MKHIHNNSQVKHASGMNELILNGMDALNQKATQKCLYMCILSNVVTVVGT